ncbi:MAG TPA: hypothetical protein ENH87_22410 [Pricia antarctica]|uniref:Uncharacterized protein n=1 Tax=Pricia antarctica TaxID=641691 RepID=A0A831QS05_9FLAO|nr:hypothetical protein [Pricia antarctica]
MNIAQNEHTTKLWQSPTIVRWQKKAYGAFSPHMLLLGPVEAEDAGRPPWLPQENGRRIAGFLSKSNSIMP